MNYLILNGKDSRDIKGLLIQSLPPITKPLIRTTIETIDGRDGDQITALGYSAYDRNVSIGLHGDFCIDDVTSYFNTKGEAIFSNEKDKYYRFSIVNQIDFERLIKFRTATVVFHVQPFKYATLKAERIYTLTESDKNITIVNSGNIYAKPIMTIYGSGDIGVSLNDIQIFRIALGDNTYITIDTESLEAYKEDDLKNRIVTGDYDKFKLNIGTNKLSFSGTVTTVKIQKFSRWI